MREPVKITAVVLLCALLTTACDKNLGSAASKNSGTESAESQTASNEAIKIAVDQKQYAVAADLAAKAIGLDPKNIDARLLQAKAEAQLGNGGNAARALDGAISQGLPNPAYAIKDPLFDPVRNDPEFKKISMRIDGGSSENASQEDAPEVEIGADGSVRAGNVSIGPNN